MTVPSPFFELRQIWELQVIPRGFVAVTYAPHTFHLTLWVVLEGQKAKAFSSGRPERIVERWSRHGLPEFSHECLVKLSALEAARA